MRGTAGVLGFLSVFLVVAQGAPSWKVVSQDMANTVFAIAFQNETTGFLPAGVDGQGAAVLRSTDAGRTWHSEAGVVGLDLLAAEAEATNVVASGMFSIVVSNDNGKSFHEAGTDMPLEGMQDVCAADSQYFGIPGAGLEGNGGISVSSNGGRNFTFYNASSSLVAFARYAAMPTRTTWYISAGDWPPAQDVKKSIHSLERKRLSNLGFEINHPMVDVHPLSRRIAVVHDKRTFVAGQPLKARKTLVILSHPKASSDDDTDDSAAQWIAQIVKTNDGGKSFVSVFEDVGKFYFNQIDCSDEDHCCAVGESDGGPEPGNRIYCTQDGGQNWKRTMFHEDPDLSIMGIKFVGPAGKKSKEVWAAGGHLAQTGFIGYFWHSMDGGYSWTNQTLNGTYGTDLSFPSKNAGFASMLTLESGPVVAAYD